MKQRGVALAATLGVAVLRVQPAKDLGRPGALSLPLSAQEVIP